MIKFFRHIRQSLIMKNQTGKYFKYAIGEIILVVIGILIALQINNWNEERKNTKIEYKLVTKMIGQSKADSLLFNTRLKGLVSLDTLFKHYIAINQGSNKVSGKIKYPGRLSPIKKFNDGTNLIRNHSQDFKQVNDLDLREELMSYAYLVTMMDAAIELLNTNFQDYHVPLILEYFQVLKPFDSTSTLQEMEAIFKNPKLEAHFELMKGLTRNVKNQIEILEDKNHSILNDLKHYIKTLNN